MHAPWQSCYHLILNRAIHRTLARPNTLLHNITVNRNGLIIIKDHMRRIIKETIFQTPKKQSRLLIPIIYIYIYHETPSYLVDWYVGLKIQNSWHVLPLFHNIVIWNEMNHFIDMLYYKMSHSITYFFYYYDREGVPRACGRVGSTRRFRDLSR